MNKTRPIRANVVVLKQMHNLIPRGMINSHALETGVEAKARTFSVVSHLSAMLSPSDACYSQQTQSSHPSGDSAMMHGG